MPQSDHDAKTEGSRQTEGIALGSDRLPVPGEVLGDRFLIKDFLGRGGTGRVYSALDSRVGQKVAVKILNPELAGELNHERLRREVRAARPGHDNVVNVFDLHAHDGFWILSMELVPGTSLRQMLAERETLPVGETVDIGVQAARALDHLHGNGLVHRDVKPGNLLITPDGKIKLCDLGLARPVASGTTVTESAMVVGTPSYMAPEQATAAELTAASDIYALGLTLYKCLTGTVPLEGDTAVETLMRRQRSLPPRISARVPGCPRWLDRLLRWMLEPDPAERPAAEQVGRALADGRVHRRVNRRVVKRAAIAAAILLAAAGSGFVIRERLGGAQLDPTTGLEYRSQAFQDGTEIEILDDRGNQLHRFVLDIAWDPRRWARAMRRVVAFGDLNGDGLEDAVIAHPSKVREQPVEFFLRQPDGSLKLDRVFPATDRFDYEGNEFLSFQLVDVHCNDLNRDGRDEVVIVENSDAFYPATVRIVNIENEVLFQLWHPGALANAQTADRDGDGWMELYVGGTNNFLTPPQSNTSDPVLAVIEADWRQSGVMSLFGENRHLQLTKPADARLFYLTWPSVQIGSPLSPWQFATVFVSETRDPATFVDITVSSVREDLLGLKTARKVALRTAYFNRDLELTQYQWNPAVTDFLGIDPTTPESKALLEPKYWTGTGWQPEPVFIQ